MSATTVLLLIMTLAVFVAGMCFDNMTASPPREVVKPSYTVGSIDDCKEECWSSADCLAFVHNPISGKCAQLGAEKQGICTGKGFYPYLKCSDTVNCDYFSEASASTTTPSSRAEFPKCQLDSGFTSTEVCDKPHPDIICENYQCFCKDPNQQMVVKPGSMTYCGVRASCSEGNKYKFMFPSGELLSYRFSISDAVCTTIARASSEKCMCNLPLISRGIRNGNEICGGGRVTGWGDASKQTHSTQLTCTPDGWSDGEKIVTPDYVLCE